MKIGYYQFNPAFGNPVKNRSVMIHALEKEKADIIVLPELSTSGYFFTSQKEIQNLSETIPGPTSDIFSLLSKKTETYYVLGIPEKTPRGIYNSAVLIGPGGIEGIYRKVHLFYKEKQYFQPGEIFPLFEINGVKIGILVCFDHMFPEAARTLALQGAQIICHPSNLVLPEYGQLTTRVRALENRVFWILSNRIGTEVKGSSKLTYTGESQIINPKGEILHKAPAQKEELYTIEIDPVEAFDKNVTETNDLFKDRKRDLYSL